MFFGTLYFKKIWHENLTDLFTSPVRCSQFTLGNPKKSFSTVLFIRTSDYLRYLRRKQTAIHPLAHPTWKCHHITLWIDCKTFSSYWRFVAFFQSWRLWTEESQFGLSSVALKRTRCGVWQLECHASNITASVQSDHLLHQYTLPVLLDTDQSHSTPQCAEIHPMSQQAAATSLNMSVSIHALQL